MPNKGTFTVPGGGLKDRGRTKVHNRPANIQYIRDMIASQKGEKPSRTVTEAEEETMLNAIWNAEYRELRNRR